MKKLVFLLLSLVGLSSANGQNINLNCFGAIYFSPEDSSFFVQKDDLKETAWYTRTSQNQVFTLKPDNWDNWKEIFRFNGDSVLYLTLDSNANNNGKVVPVIRFQKGHSKRDQHLRVDVSTNELLERLLEMPAQEKEVEMVGPFFFPKKQRRWDKEFRKGYFYTLKTKSFDPLHIYVDRDLVGDVYNIYYTDYYLSEDVFLRISGSNEWKGKKSLEACRLFRVVDGTRHRNILIGKAKEIKGNKKKKKVIKDMF